VSKASWLICGTTAFFFPSLMAHVWIANGQNALGNQPSFRTDDL